MQLGFVPHCVIWSRPVVEAARIRLAVEKIPVVLADENCASSIGLVFDGPESLSTMVSVAVLGVPSSTPVGLRKVRLMVSFPST